MTVLPPASVPVTVHPAGAAPTTSTFSENVTVTLSDPTPESPVIAETIVSAMPSVMFGEAPEASSLFAEDASTKLPEPDV